MSVVATAGHVDHGKSTLVRFLTGTDPDRLIEEKARGMSIDIGFASLTLPSGREIGFVDVPGHARFVKNMLTGVTSIDACLFVVDATEGWRAQSEEHLRILELLGVAHGVLAFTKVASTDEESVELARLDTADRVAGTFLEKAEWILTDAPSGIGLTEMCAALDRLLATVPPAPDRARPRLWVDRAFSIRGAGTVMTGTLTGGQIRVGDDLSVEPGHKPVRVRALQSHHGALRAAHPGRRVAVNVIGADPADIRRGDALVSAGRWHLTSSFDASLRVLESPGLAVGARGAFRVHIGSGNVPARIRPTGRRQSIAPGEEGTVRVWLARRALPIVPGDRFVVREVGRGTTVAGGLILDVDPVLPAASATPSMSVERVVAERGWIEADELERLTAAPSAPNLGRWVIDADARARLAAEVSERVRAAGPDGVRLASFDEVRRALVSAGVEGVVVDRDRAFCSELVHDGLSADAAEVLNLLERDPWSPPELPLSRRGALRELEKAGLAAEVGSLWFAVSAVDRAATVLAGLLSEDPSGFTVSAARNALGSSRKYLVPLLEHLDSKGVTRRIGDARVAGPRMVVSTEAR